jgi:hypothetical protein
MIYFILLPGDTKEDLYLETNLLGEDSFGTFYGGSGYKVLTKIIDKKPELLESVTVLTDTGQKLSVEEFFTILSNFKTIITN